MPVFEPVQRTVLVLEDDPMFQKILVTNCKIATRRLKTENLIINLTILRAESLSQAIQIIEEYDHTIDIISVDVALKHSDKDLSEDKLFERDTPVGGLALLETFKDAPHTLSLVVSGEKQQMYPIEAYQKYGVLNYIVKSMPDQDEVYIRSIQTALWYLTSHDSISLSLEQLEQRDLELAQLAWEKTLENAQYAKIRTNQLPQQLDTLIQEYRTKYIHEDTNLPIGDWSHAKLRRFIVQGASWIEHEPPLEPELPHWTILRCGLQGYSHFVINYSSQKQPILTIFAQSIKNVAQAYDEHIVFIGQTDRDLTQLEPYIFIILNTTDKWLISEISQKINKTFSQASPQVLPSSQLHENIDPSKYNFVLQFKTWNNEAEHDFADLHAVLDVLNRGYND